MYKLLLRNANTTWKPLGFLPAIAYLKQVWLMSLFLCSISVSWAQPTLVKDINTTQSMQGLNPENITVFKGIMYFSGYDATNGRELWRSDGTPQGTYVLKDIKPGAVSSAPSNLINVNGTLYFTANNYVKDLSEQDRTGGYELWKSDGTLAGTVKITDVALGSWNQEYEYPSQIILTKAGNTLFFTADNSGSGYNLMSTTGTKESIVTIKFVEDTSYDVNYYADRNGTLFFTNINDENGLWKSDGTTAGTVRVKEIWNPSRLTNVNSTLYFTADNDILWKSDGTTAGTVIVKDIYPGAGKAYPSNLTNVNGTLYFTAEDGINGSELWKSNGTPQGTVLVKDIVPGTEGSNPYNLSNVNGFLYFTAKNNATGNELWKSDGTTAGTILVKDINPGAGNAYPGGFTYVNGTVYFWANNGTNGQELWKTDGTTAGTVLVKDINPGSSSSNKSYLTLYNNTLYFSADDGSGPSLWKSNGTPEGTMKVKNNVDISTLGANPRYIGTFNNELFFTVDDGVNADQAGLWKSNGTTAGTTFIKNVSRDFITEWSIISSTVINGTLFFTAGNKLWKTDGTAAGTGTINPEQTYGGVSNLTNFNGTLFFSAFNEDSYTLWKSDGTDAGTVIINPQQPNNYGITSLIDVNGTLFYTVYTIKSGITGYELWKSNGTAAGTVLVKDGFSGETTSQGLTAINGTIYFSASTTANGHELWKSDGTAAGTVVIDIVAGKSGSSPVFLTNVNGTLYFGATNATSGYELWKSNGTLAGTELVKDIYPGTTGSGPRYLTNINGTLYFGASNDVYGRELWKSDGTATGTVLVKDILPGINGGFDGYLTDIIRINNFIYFKATDGTGEELWRSDGTAAGTALVSNLNPGWQGSNIGWLQNINNTLYFSAYEPKAGQELWKYEAGNCVSSIHTGVIVQGGSVCLGSNGSITIKASQSGVNYQAYFNHAPLGNAMQGNGGDLVLTIPAVSLSVGNNVYHIQANGCTVADLVNTATITLTSNCPPITCSATGSILREYWANVAGTAVSTIPVNTTPTSSSQLTSFEAPTNAGTNYGQRIRGYLCVPTSGNYTFYIAGDDNAELWLSTDEDPAKKTRIAYINYFTGVREWTKYASQKSASIALVAGKKYYIEALHKESLYGDNLAVAWILPNTTSIAVIAGSYLSPYVAQNTGKISKELWANVQGSKVSTIPLNTMPTSTGELTSFEAPSNAGNNYGQRIRGYLHPVISGNYTFYIAGDDNAELWLSTDEDPSKKVRIASINYFTGVKEWTKYTSQKSAPIALVAGKKYYIEALHKEGLYGDNLAVGWILPNTSAIAVIAGSYLSPFTATINAVARLGQGQDLQALQLNLYPNPFDSKLTLQTTQAGKLQVSVTDNLGRVVYQATHQLEASQLEIDLSKAHLKAGVYFVSIKAEDGQTKVIRVLKK